MPIPALKSVTKGSGVSVDKAEKIWKNAVKNAPSKVKNPYAYAMGAVKNAAKAESLIDKITKGEAVTSALDNLIDGDSVQFTNSHTFIAVRESRPLDKSAVKTYFDSYGELKFSTLEGVLIHERTPMMNYLVAISEVLHSDSELIDLFSSYEGTIEALHHNIVSNYVIVEQF